MSLPSLTAFNRLKLTKPVNWQNTSTPAFVTGIGLVVLAVFVGVTLFGPSPLNTPSNNTGTQPAAETSQNQENGEAANPAESSEDSNKDSTQTQTTETKPYILTGDAYQDEGSDKVRIELHIPAQSAFKAIWADYSEDKSELSQDTITLDDIPDETNQETHNVFIETSQLTSGARYHYQAVGITQDDQKIYGGIATFQAP